MTFPLFHRPGTVVFLDDDPDYLEMLALVLPRQWHLRLFLRPAEAIAHLLQEPPFWEADAWNQQQLISLWREGKPLIPQILAYWSRYTERYALSRVCVVDFSMPGMDGLQVLAELGDWPGARARPLRPSSSPHASCRAAIWLSSARFRRAAATSTPGSAGSAACLRARG